MLRFLFLSFSIFSSLTQKMNAIHREIRVKDFSEITVPRILKSETKVKYVLMHCVKENQHDPK